MLCVYVVKFASDLHQHPLSHSTVGNIEIGSFDGQGDIFDASGPINLFRRPPPPPQLRAPQLVDPQ